MSDCKAPDEVCATFVNCPYCRIVQYEAVITQYEDAIDAHILAIREGSSEDEDITGIALAVLREDTL